MNYKCLFFRIVLLLFSGFNSYDILASEQGIKRPLDEEDYSESASPSKKARYETTSVSTEEQQRLVNALEVFQASDKENWPRGLTDETAQLFHKATMSENLSQADKDKAAFCLLLWYGWLDDTSDKRIEEPGVINVIKQYAYQSVNSEHLSQAERDCAAYKLFKMGILIETGPIDLDQRQLEELYIQVIQSEHLSSKIKDAAAGEMFGSSCQYFDKFSIIDDEKVKEMFCWVEMSSDNAKERDETVMSTFNTYFLQETEWARPLPKKVILMNYLALDNIFKFCGDNTYNYISFSQWDVDAILKVNIKAAKLYLDTFAEEEDRLTDLKKFMTLLTRTQTEDTDYQAEAKNLYEQFNARISKCIIKTFYG